MNQLPVFSRRFSSSLLVSSIGLSFLLLNGCNLGGEGQGKGSSRIKSKIQSILGSSATATPTSTTTPFPGYTPTPLSTVTPTVTPVPTATCADGYVAFRDHFHALVRRGTFTSGNSITCLGCHNSQVPAYAHQDPVTAYASAKSRMNTNVPITSLIYYINATRNNPQHYGGVLSGNDLAEWTDKLQRWADGETVCASGSNATPTPVSTPPVPSNYPNRCNRANLVAFVDKIWLYPISGYPYQSGLSKRCQSCHSSGMAMSKLNLSSRFDHDHCNAALAKVNATNIDSSLLLNPPTNLGCNGLTAAERAQWKSWIIDTLALPYP